MYIGSTIWQAFFSRKGRDDKTQDLVANKPHKKYGKVVTAKEIKSLERFIEKFEKNRTDAVDKVESIERAKEEARAATFERESDIKVIIIEGSTAAAIFPKTT